MANHLFPNATIVISKLHVVRYCTWAVKNIKKRVQKGLHPDERKYFKRSRTLLLLHKDKLMGNGKMAVTRMCVFIKI